MNLRNDGRDEALWNALVEQERAFYAARAAFLSGAKDPVAVLRPALRAPRTRGAVLRMMPLLSLAQRQEFFDDLVWVASHDHANLGLAQAVILLLPRDWTLARIQATAEPLLREGTEEEYRRLLELYIQLDVALTRELAMRAAKHANEHTREAGEDFLALLDA